MLTGYDTSDTCDPKSIDKASGMLATGAGCIFLFGGAVLLIRTYRREPDLRRKHALGIATVYLGILWLMLVPLAQEVSMRFYLIAPIMPFLLLGLWLGYFRERLGGQGGERVFVVAIVLLCLSNAYVSATTLREIGGYTEHASTGDFEFITQGEAERAADYIATHAEGREAVLQGNALITFKGGKSIEYLVKRKGILLTQKTKNVAPGTVVFTLDRTSAKQDEMMVSGRQTEKSYVIGRLMLSVSRMP